MSQWYHRKLKSFLKYFGTDREISLSNSFGKVLIYEDTNYKREQLQVDFGTRLLSAW